ncbi:MAG: hypothetical protein AAF585_10900, partial [Verrucomicrobiota bacterium]
IKSESVNAADVAAAAVVLHWKDSPEYKTAITNMLRLDSPVNAFLKLESKPGSPDALQKYGKYLSKESSWFKGFSEADRQILNNRIGATRKVFEENPALLKRLQQLRFDFQTGELRGK